MTPTTLDLFSREQFRLRQLQVFNWGTFSGIHQIPIAERGYLFIGRSGAGKSTLLDAFSTLLVPPRWVDFNAAARETEKSGRDRNLVSYIRGAWADQKEEESGEIMTQYLRPGTTWSALAMSYQDTSGHQVVLAQLFWIRGNTNASVDVKRLYMIFDHPFDLKELEIFGQSNFDIRKLKLAFPDSFIRDEFRAYSERFCCLFGIENELALRLLHKTQSAKNLGDLNIFLRDFMLDKPPTFEAADRLVSEFGELNAAHQSVVTAREQVNTLCPAREQHQQVLRLRLQRHHLQELLNHFPSYRETLRGKLLEQDILSLKVEADGIAGEIQTQTQRFNHYRKELHDLELARREMGGDSIEQWENEKNTLEEKRDERFRKHKQVEEACHKLDWTMPISANKFSEFIHQAKNVIDNWQIDQNNQKEQRFSLAQQKHEHEKNFSALRKEIGALLRQPSNIPADMLELRKEVAAAIGAKETELPFVGELIEVKPDELVWQGAIERVLRGFALSLLVSERHYMALAQYLNQVNLGRRLVYYRTMHQGQTFIQPQHSTSLIYKIQVKQGSQHASWLQAELCQRFDYACVDSLQDFKQLSRALMQTGQIKHSGIRHEKDDRYDIADRRHWVLGFDNQEKRIFIEQQAQQLAETITQLSRELKALDEQDTEQTNKMMICQTVVNLQWQEIDTAPILERISALLKLIKDIKQKNQPLEKLSLQIEKQQQKIDELSQKIRKLESNYDGRLRDIQRNETKLEEVLNDTSIVELPESLSDGLKDRFEQCAEKQTICHENLDRLGTKVTNQLHQELNELNLNVQSLEKQIENGFAEFKRRWPLEAGDMDATLASVPDFFAKLDRLETDGLPAHEKRFFELLQNQSHQNLAALATLLNQARKSILERMELVNMSLEQAQFNPGTYLRIEATDRHLSEVREFRQEIQEALSHAFSEDKIFAEKRFLILQQLVDRLGSPLPEQKRWRESVLDVRQHVEFIGREINQDGLEVEVYRSGAGKSGGQRQKLATTCLAAALRYQLGGSDHHFPMYAPVILDEAFDKADNEFTALAMNIFTHFGFQMIVATPLKSVMTLEPFIGGACFVDIKNRRVSSALLIEYDDKQSKLHLPDATRTDVIHEVA